ncbi:hypothetical protein D3C78_1588250 [compost metagenome]
MVTPGVATIIAVARQIIVGQVFVVLRQHASIHGLIVIFMHQHRGGNTRFHVRVISGPAKAQAKQR